MIHEAKLFSEEQLQFYLETLNQKTLSTYYVTEAEVKMRAIKNSNLNTKLLPSMHTAEEMETGMYMKVHLKCSRCHSEVRTESWGIGVRSDRFPQEGEGPGRAPQKQVAGNES